MGLLRKIWALVNRDVTGKTFTREANHPYFGRIIYFGSTDPSKGYWEAELRSADGRPVGVTVDGTLDGPEPEEVVFCQSVLGNLDALFARCRESFEKEYSAWAEGPFPSKWQGTFLLDGISLPRHGDPARSWSVCYFVEPAGHYFTAEFESGQVQRVVVDG